MTGLQQVSVSSCENAVFRNATGWRSLGQGFVFEKRRAMHDPFLGNYHFICRGHFHNTGTPNIWKIQERYTLVMLV